MSTMITLLLLCLGLSHAQDINQASSSIRRNRFSASKPHATQFNCPEDFGYYPHPDDCTKYYVCVFGGALLESCNGGLMYSNDLQTCDWPRNVACFSSQPGGVSTVNVVDSRTPSKSGSRFLTATESLPRAANIIRGGVDNEIRPSRPIKISSPKRDFLNDNRIRQARLIPQEQAESQRISRGFQAEETASHSFNVVATSPKPRIAFPPALPGVSQQTNHFSLTPTRVKSSKADELYTDLLSLNDTDFQYYEYDYLLDDYYDQPAKPTTTQRPIRKRPSSSGKRPKPVPQGPPKTVGSTPLRSRPVRPSKKPPVTPKGTLISDVWKYPPQRPRSLYSTPQPDIAAARCDPKICRLPDCSCGGAPVPGNIPPQNVPQLVLLTFDDSINDLNRKLYVDFFERGRVNPNGCPIVSTMYVSHEWTDYSQVQNLYADGHEIASHSITHSFGEQFSTLKWAREISGQREIMSAYGGVRMEDIRGMRAPFLAIGGNNMFRMLYDQNFTYDSSMPVYDNNPPSWPYTLDYKIFHSCMIPPCPTNSYPGLWEVPMVMWQDLNGGRCSMGDACTTPPNAEGVYQMLIKNFERHYTTNRAPFGLFYHAAWFTRKHHKEGFVAFLDTISNMDDVWLVTNWQAIQWVRDPQPLSTVKQFKPFGCDYPERPPRCTSPKVCNVWHRGSVRYLKTCQQCPETYPWVGKTGVRSSLNV